MRNCEFPGCRRPHLAKGWCNGHYKQNQLGKGLRSVAQKRSIIINPSDPSESLIPTASGVIARIDTIDSTAAAGINWNIYRPPNSRTSYVAGRSNGKTEKLHRFIAFQMGLMIDGIEVDHRDGDGLNCHRSNLRAATREQNRRNTKIQANNTSGHKGVTWHKKNAKWSVKIGVGKAYKYLGYYDDLELAAFVYAEAAAKFHGEFARAA